MSYLVSTKGRYALRVMLDLAENTDRGYIPLKEIAERQEISLKYMETIMPKLTKAGFVNAIQGKGGGYKLSGPADQFSVGDILSVTEENLGTTACVENGFICPRMDNCKTIKVWKNLDNLIDEYLKTISLTDLLE